MAIQAGVGMTSRYLMKIVCDAVAQVAFDGRGFVGVVAFRFGIAIFVLPSFLQDLSRAPSASLVRFLAP